MTENRENIRLSPTAYLQQEETAATKSEYLAGELFPMVGGTANHNRIVVSLCSALDARLEKGRCEVFSSDLKLWVEAYDLFTYPDVMVICGAVQYYPGRMDVVANPTLIAEVLSKSTGGLDKGEKFTWYRALDSLQDYLLIDQYRVHVDWYHKLANGRWLLTEYVSLEDVLSLESINVELPIRLLYQRVDWSRV
ncbi:Uma2 family endonuclease [Caldilinea sp.]|jgi:Uma2 family endonuclease|uniref:Uma2 family endonuclease n=1 Tax=Caldilinea sp. TaxID=2293560 RepID=UPI002639A1F4|nr:Uma2 family endonuclease [uncultured Caldilinea sp.]